MRLPLDPVILLVICGALLPLEIVARSLPPAIVETTPAIEETTSAIPLQPQHISRSKRAIPSIPMDFHTKHLPCDMDLRGGQSYMSAFPNQCVWAYNNRYRSEDNYAIYKTYQLESFFFGQYHERLKRYEVEPHSYDYN